MIKILGKSASINVRKVLWTCDELGLRYEREDWGAGFQSTQTDAFRALNPNAMVPVLVDGDFVLWESNSICRYLAQHSQLLPNEPKARAKVEQWMDWQAGELNNSWRYAFMSIVRASPLHQDAAQLAAGVANWNHHVQILEAQLAQTQAFVTGESFTLADVVLGLSVNRWLLTPFDKPDLPHVLAYHQRLRERVGFRWCDGVV
ncbi:MAG: glutathione S-transferase family protein [Formosimonas sp.]